MQSTAAAAVENSPNQNQSNQNHIQENEIQPVQSNTELKMDKSATQLKKLQRQLVRAERWKAAKRAKIEEKARARELRQEPTLDMSPEAVLRRHERMRRKKEQFAMGIAEGHTFVIDCGFEAQMKDKEINSLSQQLMFCYGANRKSQTPASVYLTDVMTEDSRIMRHLNNIGGYRDWVGFHATSNTLSSAFEPARLVYLTADSPNVLSRLEKDKVYVIGGIVDRNRLKNCTFQKAQELGIATAKLPLDQLVDPTKSSRVLTVNQVFELLHRFIQMRDWTEASLQVLPNRKTKKEN